MGCVACNKEPDLLCPVDGSVLTKVGENIYSCPNGHAYRIEYQITLGPEVECYLGPFKIGKLPQTVCSIIQIVTTISLVGIGIYAVVSIVSSLFGRKREERRVIII
ncbi:MAG: hypothetical protein QXK87_06990 [Fervidicoccaceae archaeon]